MLLSRPRFSWDNRKVNQNDGKGSQEQFASSADLWKLYPDKLPNSNANKIPHNLHGVILKSKLYGIAADLCKGLSKQDLTAFHDAKEVVECVKKRDALAVISDSYQYFMTLLTTKRGNTESFKIFESRFDSQVSKIPSAL